MDRKIILFEDMYKVMGVERRQRSGRGAECIEVVGEF